MDELPPRMPSPAIAMVTSPSEELMKLSTPKLTSGVTRTRTSRRKLSRSHSAPVANAEGDKTPPLLSPKAHLKANKKRSPTSTFEFYHAEEMKVAVPDEHYQDSLVRILQQLIPHPLAIDPNDPNRSDGYDDPSEIKAKPSTNQKPPLKPSPTRFPRSDSDQSAGDGHQGELSTLRLADDCLENHDITTALALYKSLLQELDRVYGRSNSRTAQCVHQIGECYLLLGDFGKAIRYLETAIHIRSVVLGVHHLDVAASMEKLAVAQLHLNEVELAHDVYRRALRIKRSLLGLYHEDVAHIQTQLACIYFYSGELLSAQAAFEEALDVYRHLASLSTGNPGLWLAKSADTLGSIGSIKLSQKLYSGAVRFFADALKAQIHVYGLYHPLVIITLDNLGYAHSKDKRYTQSSEIYEEMLHAQTAFFQGYNLDCYETLKKLCLVYCKMDQLDAAIDATLEAIAVQRRALSRDKQVFDKTQRLLQRLEKKKEQAANSS